VNAAAVAVRWTAAAYDARSRLAAAKPSVVMLSGPLSAEDQTYFRSASAEVLSHTTLPAALRDIGLDEVRVVDVASVTDWLSAARRANLVLVNLHGSPGEDGTIQGALDSHEIRYIGSGVEASVVALNKHLAKLVVSSIGVPTPSWCVAIHGRIVAGAHPDGSTIVKPLCGGSSIDTRICDAEPSVPPRGAWIIESFCQGMDITVTVVEALGKPAALPAVTLSYRAPYYSEEVKFGDQWNHGVVAERPPGLAEAFNYCEQWALQVHEAIGARHVSRSDFVLPETGGEPLFLELNTLPGLSKVSNAAECAYAAGLGYADFVALIVAAGMPGS
jgi:D-alanine-D-alanine ligase